MLPTFTLFLNKPSHSVSIKVLLSVDKGVRIKPLVNKASGKYEALNIAGPFSLVRKWNVEAQALMVRSARSSELH